MTDDTLPPIELQAPDIARWKDGGSGVDWVHVLDSGRPGPKAMVQALTHGNEICGAIALDWLLASGFRPQRGTLTVAFANVEAYARYDPADPFPSRLVDEDYNRVWSDDALFGSRDSLELRRARLLRPFVDAAELLLDIHSMSEPCRPLMVCGTVEKNVAYARELGVPGDLLIDTGHPAGMRMVDRGGFGDPASPKRALLIECGQHWERAAAEVAIDALVRFLGLSGVADAGLGAGEHAAAAAAGAAPGARDRAGGGAERRLPLPRADRRPLGDREGRHADRARRRPDLDHALRRCGAGDAGNAQPQTRRDGSPARTVRGVERKTGAARKARAGRCGAVSGAAATAAA